MNAETIQFRHEYKCEISYSDYLVIRQRLNAIMKRDPHVSEKGSYMIRSLYFDTPTDQALREKMDGISEREKYRIRCYDHDHNYIRLEKKVKKAGLGYKASASLTKEETRRILASDTEWMKDSKEALLVEFYTRLKYQGLQPKTLVDYTREPYIYGPGNVRVTLDHHIRTGLKHTDLLDRQTPTIEASPGTVILEVKYDNFLPDVIRDIVQLRNREEGAFSKYAACRQYL